MAVHLATRAVARSLATVLVAIGAVTALPSNAGASEVITPPVSGSWQVEGRGWGHGIGLSQWGAQGAALRGLTAEQILDFYYPGTTRYDIGQDYPLRVRLTALTGTSALTLGPVPGEHLVVTDVSGGQSVDLSTDERLTVTRTGGGFSASTVGASSHVVTFGGAAAVAGPLTVRGSGAARVWTYASSGAGTRYDGSVRVNALGQDTLETVNDVPMEQYLRGVVPREVPSSWEPAALEAQAVAARTYALAVRQTQASADLCDTTACQVYAGSATSTSAGVVAELYSARTDAAVSATARIARYFGGGPALTQFSSTNGGWTKAGNAAYLPAKADPYTGTAPGDTRTRWTDTLPVARVEQSCPSTGGRLLDMSLVRDGNGDLGGRIVSAVLHCTTGTASVATPAFGLYSSWWAVTSVGRPYGNLDSVQGTSAGLRVQGWVVDPDSSEPVTVRIAYGTASRTTVARLDRPDVGALLPAAGPRHGFDVVLPASPGEVSVCVSAVNVGPGSDLSFGCVTVVVPSGVPFGSVDSVVALPGLDGTTPRVAVTGWAADPDAPGSPTTVDVEVDGSRAGTATANAPRSDIGAALPGYGNSHGYNATVPLGQGTHEVCVRVRNLPTGDGPVLGCSTVTGPGGSPVGNIDVVASDPGGVRVAGWAVDPDTVDAVYVYVTVGGAGGYLRADGARPDVAAAFPGYGGGHGFSGVVEGPEGMQTVCVTISNVGTGTHTALGCRTVTVPGGSPRGNLDGVHAVPGGYVVQGWAVDPQSVGPIYGWVSDSAAPGGPVLAGGSRPDIAAAFPGYGAGHGIESSFGASAGVHTVCLTGVNVGRGGDALLGCRTVTVPGGSPAGNVDVLRGVAGGVQIAGWALDPDTVDAPYVWVTIDGAGSYLRANLFRPDVAAAFPGYGADFGFSGMRAASAGAHDVCLTVSNVGVGGHTSLGCRSVVVPAG